LEEEGKRGGIRANELGGGGRRRKAIQGSGQDSEAGWQEVRRVLGYFGRARKGLRPRRRVMEETEPGGAAANPEFGEMVAGMIPQEGRRKDGFR
jgi:hypothetical protein